MENVQRIGVIHMKQFNIKKFKQIEVNELELIFLYKAILSLVALKPLLS